MISDEDISIYINAGKNSNTVEKTKNDLTRLNNWRKISLKDANPVPIEQIEADELNKLLRSFFLTIKKVNGEDYEPSSLRSMLGSFSRHLQEAKYPIKVMEGNVFKDTRDVVYTRLKELTSNGKGRLPNKAQPLSYEEEELLWEKGVMGSDSPVSLQNAIWWRNNFFGLRGRDEHKKLKWGDIKIEEELDGTRYLVYNERDTKTRKDYRQQREVEPKIFEIKDQPDRCPVVLLLRYTQKRPMQSCLPDSPFYLQPLQPNQMKDSVWYKNGALGVHSLGNIMKKMAAMGQLSGRKTNHSGRKTTVKRLRDANFEAVDIMKITGHKNITSINNYSELPEERHKKISKILTKPLAPKNTITDQTSNRDAIQPSVAQNQQPVVYSDGILQPSAPQDQQLVGSSGDMNYPDLFDDFNFDDVQWAELCRQTDGNAKPPTFNNCTFSNCTLKM